MQRNIRNKPLECKRKEFGITYGEAQNRPFVTSRNSNVMALGELPTNGASPTKGIFFWASSEGGRVGRR